MPENKKEQLIQALAASLGQNNIDMKDTRYTGGVYDSSTGTLYCQGYIISKCSIEEAKEFFRIAKSKSDRLADTDTVSRNASLYYQTAIEAITLMQKGAMGDGSRYIIGARREED